MSGGIIALIVLLVLCALGVVLTGVVYGIYRRKRAGYAGIAGEENKPLSYGNDL